MRRAQPWITLRARTMRANETSAEQKLWGALRNRQLGGLKFSRQISIAPFFADFVCRDLKLIVEVDGATHSTPDELAKDSARDAVLAAKGYRVFRVHNDELYNNLDGVLDTLLAFASESGG